MSRLAAQAEVVKLAHALDVPAATLEFLHAVPPGQLRSVREAVYERLFAQDQILFQRVARWIRWLPGFLVSWFATMFGAVCTAHVVGEMPARRAARLAQRLPAAFLAEVCVHLDPRHAREIIGLLPQGCIVAIALQMIVHRDYQTMGRFADFLSDDAIRAVLDQVDDDEILLRIAYFMESRNRLDHVVRLLPRERLRRAILLALDESRNILVEVMSLLAHVSYALQRELGDLAAEQDERVLHRIIYAAHEHELWADLLPVIANLSTQSLRKVVNLPILRNDIAVLDGILLSTADHQLWSSVLPLVQLMDDGMRESVAHIANGLSHAELQDAVEATLMGEHWGVMIDLMTQMMPEKQVEAAGIIRGYGAVDAELFERVRRQATGRGMGSAFEQAAA
ncbi:MAG: hypothetical protein ACRETW_06830 [Stenotrophobium sp.]